MTDCQGGVDGVSGGIGHSEGQGKTAGPAPSLRGKVTVPLLSDHGYTCWVNDIPRSRLLFLPEQLYTPRYRPLFMERPAHPHRERAEATTIHRTSPDVRRPIARFWRIERLQNITGIAKFAPQNTLPLG